MAKYTLSSFSSICGVTPRNAVAFVNADNWFEMNCDREDVKRFVKLNFNTDMTAILSCDRSKTLIDGFVEIDKSIKNITTHNAYSLTELAAIVFSVNSNKKVFDNIAAYIKTAKKDYYSESQRAFIAHISWLSANCGSSLVFPDYIMSDVLLKEEIRIYNQMYGGLTPCNIPLRDSNVFETNLYLVFKIVIQMSNFSRDNEFVQCINNGLLIDIHKFNAVYSNL